MSPRAMALALLALAAAVYAGIAVPAQRKATEARAEHQRLWQQRQDARARLAAVERHAVARRRALAASGGALPSGDPLAALRRSTLASLQGAAVSGVRLEVHPGRSPVAATLRLSAEGPSAEIIRLAGYVARPGAGLVLDHVRFGTTRSGLLLDLDGFSLGGAP